MTDSTSEATAGMSRSGRGGNANSAKTHCKNGHPLADPKTSTDTHGRRTCRTCQTEYQKRWRLRHPEHQKLIWRRTNDLRRAGRRRTPDMSATVDARGRAKRLDSPGAGVSLSEWRGRLALFAGRCAYCAKVAKLTMDHIEPLSRGGAHDVANVVPACKSCNSRKCNLPLLRWLSILNTDNGGADAPASDG